MSSKSKSSVGYIVGDVVRRVTIEDRPRVVNYRTIANRFEWREDDEYRRPWDDCDDLEHTFIPVDNLDPDRIEEYKSSAGWVSRAASVGWSGLLRIDDKAGDAWGTFGYWRSRGASVQVAREKVADNYRKTLELLRRWYVDGWDYSYGVCEWEEFSSSYCGFVDIWRDDEYRKACEAEIIGDVVAQAERAGFVVVDKPKPAARVRYSALTSAGVSTRDSYKSRAWRKRERIAGRRLSVPMRRVYADGFNRCGAVVLDG